MTRICEIDPDVQRKLQSQITLHTMPDAIRELIENSLDAEATNVKVTLKVDFVNECVAINCVDNGKGMDPESLELLGKRCHTSKLHGGTLGFDLEQLKNLRSFGFRGEALNSLFKLCAATTVVSRNTEYRLPFEVNFIGDKKKGNVVKYNKSDFDCGTEINAIDLFSGLVVRKKKLLEELNKGWFAISTELRKCVFSALVNRPWVKLELLKEEIKKNGYRKKVMIRCQGIFDKKMSDLQVQMKLLREIYREKICEDYEICRVQFKDYHLKTAIGFSTKQSKDYQFVFLNGRPLINNELSRNINQKFQKHFEKWGFRNKNGTMQEDDNFSKICGKPFSTNAIFIANFECPIEASDLIQDPAKICYHTKNLKILTTLFDKVIDVYFGINKKKRSLHDKGVEEGPKLKKLERSDYTTGYLGSKTFTKMSESKESELKGRSRNESQDQRGESVTHNSINDENIESMLEKDGILDSPYHECEGCSGCHDSINGGTLTQREIKRKSGFFNTFNNVELKREDFNSSRVVGQVDNKFIVVRMDNQQGKSSMLVLDQHACDERVNVEQMFKSMIEMIFLMNSKDKLKLFELAEPIDTEFTEQDIEMMKSFISTLSLWGIEFDQGYKRVTHLPPLIGERVKQKKIMLQRGIKEFISNIACHRRRRLTGMKKCIDIKSTWWWVQYIPQMPELYREIIKSKACRTSIMFGHVLSRQQCNQLVSRLAHCRFPFICAHGRPSCYPVCGW